MHVQAGILAKAASAQHHAEKLQESENELRVGAHASAEAGMHCTVPSGQLQRCNNRAHEGYASDPATFALSEQLSGGWRAKGHIAEQPCMSRNGSLQVHHRMRIGAAHSMDAAATLVSRQPASHRLPSLAGPSPRAHRSFRLRGEPNTLWISSGSSSLFSGRCSTAESPALAA